MITHRLLTGKIFNYPTNIVCVTSFGLPPFGIPLSTLGLLLSLLHIRLVICSPVTSVVALGCNNFCKCPFSACHPTDSKTLRHRGDPSAVLDERIL